jgi:hypothetical protein
MLRKFCFVSTIISLLGFWLLACNPTGSGNCACSTEYRTLSLTIVDSMKHPIADAVVKAYLEVSTTPLNFTSASDSLFAKEFHSHGEYIIFSDGYANQISGKSSVLNVHIEHLDKARDLKYILKHASCGCPHFDKVSGLDTLIL